MRKDRYTGWFGEMYRENPEHFRQQSRDDRQRALARSSEPGICLAFPDPSGTGEMVEAWKWSAPYCVNGFWLIDVRFEGNVYVEQRMSICYLWKPRLTAPKVIKRLPRVGSIKRSKSGYRLVLPEPQPKRGKKQ